MSRILLKKPMFLLILFLCSYSLYSQSLHGARAQGMGGAFSALSDDPNSLTWNPAGLGAFRENSAITHYTSMYNGFCDDVLGTGALGYVQHLSDEFSIGFTADILYSDIYIRDIFTVAGSQKVNKKIFLGIRTKLFWSNFRKDNFIYGIDDVPEDPFFDDYGYSKTSFGLDIGSIYKLRKDLQFGAYIRNLLQPDLALSDIESKNPLQFRLGGAYTWQNKLILSLETEFDSELINENAMNIFFGAEYWAFKKTIGIRTGVNSDHLSAGATYKHPTLLNLQIDYAFIYPLSRVGEEVPGSHKVSVSLGFLNLNEDEVVIEDSISLEFPDTVFTDDFDTIPVPFVELDVTPEELYLAEVKQIYEEEPLIPVVFFDPSSDKVDERFNPLIFTIAERIANNPNVLIHLQGYYDPRSETNQNNLAQRRAEALRKRFIELVPECASNVHVRELGYSLEHERAGLGRNAPTQEQQLMINEENRRVEFRLEIRDGEIANFLYDSTPEDIIADYHKILVNNPDVDLIIEGGGSSENFQKAFEFEEKLLESIPDEYRDRIFVSLAQSGDNRIRLNAHGVIFRPRQVRTSQEHSEIETPAQIDIKYHVPGGFREYAIGIVDLDGNEIRDISKGSGEPPKDLKWDWLDKNGQLVDIKEKYLARIVGADNYGNVIVAYSDDTLQIHVTNKEIVNSKLLIVQFVYDEDIAQSIYLEDRLEYISRKLIEFATEKDKTLEIEISGHTDILGTIRRNMELSIERADEEYLNIRQYIKELQEIDSDDALDLWLKSHDTRIIFNGYGPTKPYEITRIIDGKEQITIIGDNDLPEGRTINRRVLIEMKLEKVK